MRMKYTYGNLPTERSINLNSKHLHLPLVASTAGHREIQENHSATSRNPIRITFQINSKYSFFFNFSISIWIQNLKKDLGLRSNEA